MIQSNKCILYSGILYTVLFFNQEIDFTFCLGAFTLGVLFCAYKYYLIKEVICGEHTELVNSIEERLDHEENS